MNRLGLVVATVTLAALACEPAPTAPTALPDAAREPAPPLSGRAPLRERHEPQAALGLVPCTPLPDAAIHQRVGPAGAVLHIGPHRLVIPRGALARTYTIEAVVDQDLVRHTTLVKLPTGRTVRESYSVVNAVHFSPHLKFRRAATITLSFANCDVQVLEAAQTKVVYTNPALTVIHTVLRSDVDVAAQSVSAELDHFSNYAVAW